MKKLLFPISLALVLSWGCQPSAPAPGTPSDKGATKSPDAKTTEPEAPKKVVTRAEIPAGTLTLGYTYSGLEMEASPTFEVKGGRLGLQSGAVETELLDITDGKATFRQRYTGSLDYMGTSEVMATPEGVFSVKLGEHPVDPPQKELPANPKVGDKWVNKTKMELEGSTVQESSYVVTGTKKIKTKAGEFDTLVVKATVKALRNGKSQTSEIIAYYAKKVGPVRLEIKAPGTDGKMVESTMEATKLP